MCVATFGALPLGRMWRCEEQPRQPRLCAEKAEEIDNQPACSSQPKTRIELDILEAVDVDPPNSHSAVLSINIGFVMSELQNFDRMFRLDGKVALVTGGQ